MKLIKVLISFITLLLFSFSAVAQDTPDEAKASLNSGTINSQFDYLYKKSPKWTDPRTGQRYKTVKVNNLFKFKENVSDSIKLVKQKYQAANATIATQKTEIETLKTSLGETNDNLSSVTKEKDEIKFLGLPMSKSGYNTILWSIIGVLAAATALFIGKFKRSNVITVDAKKDKDEIEEEFESYRQRSIEREQKLRRELQDEINKQKYANDAPKK